jgi:hypothetical protein
MTRSGQTWTCFLVAVLAFAAYMANGRLLGSGDSYPTRYVPLSIVREGNTNLDEFPGLLSEWFVRGSNRVIMAEDGHHYSTLPNTTAYLAVPTYWAAGILGLGPKTSVELGHLAKLSAAVIAAVCAGIMTWVLARFVQGWRLWLLSAAYALGSPMWPVASQDLWTLTSAQFFSVLAICCLVKGLSKPYWTIVALLPLGLAFLSRPPQVVALLLVIAYILLFYRKQLYRGLVLGSPILLLLVLSRTHLSGNYYTVSAPDGPLSLFRFDPAYILHVLIRLTFDLSQGLVIYSAYVVFSTLGVVIVLKDRRQPPHQMMDKSCRRLFLLFGLIAVGYLLLYSGFTFWRGGWSLTNRYFLDATPYAVMLLIPVVSARPRRRLLAGGLALSVVLAVLINGLVTFYADLEWLVHYHIADGRERQDYTLEQSLLFYVGRKALRLGDSPILDENGNPVSPEPYSARGNLIPVAPVIDPSALTRLRMGWCDPEDFGVWACYGSNFPIPPIGPPSGQGKAVLAVHLESDRDHTLRVKAQPYCDKDHQDQTLRIRYNGHDVGDFSLPCRGYWEPYTLEAVIPSAWISSHVDRLEFVYSSYLEGDLADASPRLAVAFTEVTLGEIHREAEQEAQFYFVPRAAKTSVH